MKLQEIKEISKMNGIKAGKMNKAELIRTIQRAEGNNDCFATSYARDCNQSNCLWREDCSKLV
jgi:hypothetical protein